MLTTGPRGTKDILPSSSSYWRYIESKAQDICRLHNYQEIRTPVFEHTELFLRGIGGTTDIVEKEMYSFNDRGGRNITLRPENTASVVRAYLENKLYVDAVPTKVFYIGPMFRYDRPQAGRFRQFHQFGIEAIGAKEPVIDAEIIALAISFFQSLGLCDLKLYINSVGCPDCRPIYREKLRTYFADRLSDLCPDCQSRYERNPLRILDCKNEKCSELSKHAPHVVDCLCDDCKQHFEKLKDLLTAAGIPYILNTRLVRGLDYYTKTAFEIQYAPLGAQSAICGGGRYDGLVEEIGGPKTPGIGFAIGLERVLLALEKQSLLPEIKESLDIFVVTMGEGQKQGFALLNKLRSAGHAADMDFMDRSLKAQMKQANRLAARFVAIIGDDEAAQDKVMLKDMQTGEQQLIDTAKVQEILSER